MTIEKYYPKNIKKQSFKFNELIIFSILLIYVYLIADPISSLLGTSSHTNTFGDFNLHGLAAILILAPLVEEVTFRIHLSGEKKHAWGLVLMLLSFSIFMKFGWAAIIILLFSGFVFLIYDEFSKFVTEKFFNTIFFASCLLFSLAHYDQIDTDLFYVKIFIVLIYLPISIYFAYARKKYGLAIAIGAHSFYNFSALAINSLIY